MPLGSGLFGVGMPPAGSLQDNTGWVSAEGGQGYAGGEPMDVREQQTGGTGGVEGFGNKFVELLGNPMFQMGVNLLGASRDTNPWGTALHNTLATQGMFAKQKHDAKKLDLDERKAQQEFELGTQNAATGRTNAETGIKRLGIDERQLDAQIPYWEAQVRQRDADAALERQKIDMAKRQMGMEEGLYSAIMNRGGGQVPQMPQQMPQQAPMQAPAGAGAGAGGVGKYGTPAWLLDNLAQVESSGNPKAVNPQSGAMGMYQFMPGTVQMLAKKGMQFDPMDGAASRDAADFYMQDLLKASGGDYKAALKSYGGFVTKDPTEYQNKVLKGAPQGVPQGAPQQQGNAAGIAAPDTQLGVLASMVKPQVGQALMKEAEMAQERALKARQFQLQERGLVNDEAGMALRTPGAGGVSPTDRSQMTAGAMGETAKTMEKEYGEKMSRIPEQFQNLQTARTALKDIGPFIGKGGEVKLEAVKLINNNLGWAGIQLRPEQVKNAEVLRSTMEQQVTSLLKSIDPNPTERQQEALRRALGGLGTDPGALPQLIDVMEETLRTRASGFNKRYDEAKAGGVPFSSDLRVKLPEKAQVGASGEGGAMSLDEYLASKRPKRTDTPISPREAVGKINFGGR